MFMIVYEVRVERFFWSMRKIEKILIESFQFHDNFFLRFLETKEKNSSIFFSKIFFGKFSKFFCWQNLIEIFISRTDNRNFSQKYTSVQFIINHILDNSPETTSFDSQRIVSSSFRKRLSLVRFEWLSNRFLILVLKHREISEISINIDIFCLQGFKEASNMDFTAGITVSKR